MAVQIWESLCFSYGVDVNLYTSILTKKNKTYMNMNKLLIPTLASVFLLTACGSDNNDDPVVTPDPIGGIEPAPGVTPDTDTFTSITGDVIDVSDLTAPAELQGIYRVTGGIFNGQPTTGLEGAPSTGYLLINDENYTDAIDFAAECVTVANRRLVLSETTDGVAYTAINRTDDSDSNQLEIVELGDGDIITRLFDDAGVVVFEAFATFIEPVSDGIFEEYTSDLDLCATGVDNNTMPEEEGLTGPVFDESTLTAPTEFQGIYNVTNVITTSGATVESGFVVFNDENYTDALDFGGECVTIFNRRIELSETTDGVAYTRLWNGAESRGAMEMTDLGGGDINMQLFADDGSVRFELFGTFVEPIFDGIVDTYAENLNICDPEV